MENIFIAGVLQQSFEDRSDLVQRIFYSREDAVEFVENLVNGVNDRGTIGNWKTDQSNPKFSVFSPEKYDDSFDDEFGATGYIWNASESDAMRLREV